MDPGMVGAAAEPLLAQRVVPQRTVERPGLAVILRSEEASRQGAAPQHAGLVGAARLDCPDQLQRPVGRCALDRGLGYVALRLRRVDRAGDRLPAGPAVTR